MKRKVKLMAVLFLVCLSIAGLININIKAAGNDNRKFKMLVQDHGGATANDGLYRATKYADNLWKVRLDKSGEGEGTITMFWLENYGGKNVSKIYYVVQGRSANYYPAFASASKTDVYLTVQNNNLRGNKYSIEGVWDNETGIYR